MQSCELLMSISALACCIAKNCSDEEISLLSSVFSQLGESLSTIETQNALYASKTNAASHHSENANS